MTTFGSREFCNGKVFTHKRSKIRKPKKTDKHQLFNLLTLTLLLSCNCKFSHNNNTPSFSGILHRIHSKVFALDKLFGLLTAERSKQKKCYNHNFEFFIIFSAIWRDSDTLRKSIIYSNGGMGHVSFVFGQ